ncbi:helix-turn-helix transcriptional regulator [Saccharothrix xinjiangensis]|uniref:Helix-turn-helix domain-containing protein n=1 Tax=Saccharothrix xinjiangensis TaxID=204798 RepID=A0ABV9YDB1_9PSEU
MTALVDVFPSDAFDLPPEAEAVYSELLAVAPVSGRGFLSDVGPRAAHWVEQFVGLGLVHRDEDGVLHVRPPRTALETWATRRELAAARARQTGDALARLYAACRGPGSGFVEVVEGRGAARALFRTLQRGARERVRGLDRGPYLHDSPAAPEEVQLDAMRRGLRYRAVYDASLLHDDVLLEAVGKAAAAGEETRVFPDVPLKLLLADDNRGLVMLPRPAERDADALLVYPSRLLEVLSEVFEVFWRLAAPLPATAAADPAGPDPQAQRLLVLLTAGMTDEAIARDLGVSERTVHRRVSRLQELLGARTRFQLGVQATRRGWL